MIPAPPPRDRRLSDLEAVIREQIGKIEQSYYHHEIERDGWLSEDECYRKVVNAAVSAILEADRRAAEGERLALVELLKRIDRECVGGMPKVQTLWDIRSALGRGGEGA